MSAGACRTSGILQRMLMLRLPVAMSLMFRLTVAMPLKVRLPVAMPLMLRPPVAILPLFSNGLRN